MDRRQHDGDRSRPPAPARSGTTTTGSGPAVNTLEILQELGWPRRRLVDSKDQIAQWVLDRSGAAAWIDREPAPVSGLPGRSA